MTAKRLRVLVLCGGKSAERRVSLVSAKTVLDHLDPRRYRAELVYIDARGRWLRAEPRRLMGKVAPGERAIAAGSRALSAAERLAPAGSSPDVVFPVLHGPLGEDGTVQGLLELAGLPYVGCGVAGSAVGMDKELSKRLAERAGLPVLPWSAARAPEEALAAARALGYPVFIKPARLGSSVGVGKAKDDRQALAAAKEALRYDDKLVVEKGIAAREIECAVLGDPAARAGDPLALRASVVGEIVPRAEFYDYRAKYLDPEGAELKIPAALAAKDAERVRELSLLAFRAHDGYAMARVDFLMEKAGGALYFNELNTIPGFTAASMYPLLWKASGLETRALLDRLIRLALRRHAARAKLKSSP